MNEIKNKVGRPVQKIKASARCEFRVEPEKKALYEAEADKKGLKLGAWLKGLADKEIE